MTRYREPEFQGVDFKDKLDGTIRAAHRLAVAEFVAELYDLFPTEEDWKELDNERNRQDRN